MKDTILQTFIYYNYQQKEQQPIEAEALAQKELRK